eukprot:8149260-Ditylum_brightwellii.AAC.1
MTAGGALLMAKAIGTWDRVLVAPGYLAVEQFQFPTASVEGNTEVMAAMEDSPFPLKALDITNLSLFT